MVLGLVPQEEEERLCKKLIEYYRQLYPGIEFGRKDVMLSHQEVGDLFYTYSGEETEATAAEKMRMISSAISAGYATPLLLLQKKNKRILLDGHRRARVAYSQGMGWKAMVIIPGRDVKFGIEDMVLGKIKDLYGK